ncbi:uncharacterized protein LY89DRAFT_732182 [Mollisia scopiformis]|uniref:Uncharacterized protein n=1 Tax=Mollisia scopiformis TaxID=149040 RepID=A0A194XER2_MOLSC|nr:uncharacterized protein LY89DRAFT_732182 [Mollisia scopiformis]KUJ18629.1 hypothetical protein LY89DRAFT_732182 [Mollisia scopiformis]
MPHACKGVQHHCPGAKRPVDGGGVHIPAGGCRYKTVYCNPGQGRYCETHEYYCAKHDWIYMKNATCRACDKEKIKRIAELKKQKEADDEENKRGPSKKKKGKGKEKDKTKNTKKTINKQEKNKKKAADAKKAATTVKVLNLWLSGEKTIDLEQLKNSHSHIVFTDGFNSFSLEPIVVLNAIAPFLYDQEGLNLAQVISNKTMLKTKPQALSRYNLRSCCSDGSDTDTEEDNSSDDDFQSATDGIDGEDATTTV